MKNERRTTPELNTLSAYLDNALPAQDKARLEERLKQEPELREQLENLRRTKIILSYLPRIKAPRNFTLTPDMVTVRRKKRQPLFTALRLASSLAAILLVVLFGVELIVGGSLQDIPLTASEPMMEAARVADQEATPEPLIIWSEPGVGGGAAVEGMGGDSSISEEPMQEMEPPQPETEAEEEALPQEQPEAEVESFGLEDEATDGKNLILGINPDEGGEIIDRSAPETQPEEAPFSLPVTIRWLQIALAAIALIGALTLLVLRKRRFS